jgi:hypothetical protein
MKRNLLLAYHVMTGFSDTVTGILLVVAPQLTLHLMHLHASREALPFLSFIGAFVLSVGLACIYGGRLVACGGCAKRLETVWLLTAITRGIVAVFVTANVFAGALEGDWMTVAVCDGACTVLQSIGLARGWLSNEGR